MKPQSTKIMVDEHGMNYFSWAIMCDSFFSAPYIKKFTGQPFTLEIMIIEGEHGQWAPSIQNVKNLAESVMQKIESNTFNIKEIERLHLFFGQKVLFETKAIYSFLDKRNFAQKLSKLWKNYGDLCCLGFVIVWSDIEYGLLTKKLEKILLAKGLSPENVQKNISLLISPTEKIAVWKEKKELLEIAVKNKTLKSASASKEFKLHCEKYKWLQYGYQGPELDTTYFQNELKKIFKATPKLLLENHLAYFSELKKQQKILTNTLRLSAEELRFFEVAKKIMYLKAYRVDVRHFFHWYMDKIFKKLGIKYHLPLSWFHYSERTDILKLIKTGEADAQKGILRSKFMLRVSENGKMRFISKANAPSFLKKYVQTEKIIMSSEISGATAFPGLVKGTVKIVLSRKDVHKVNKGDILVASATNPDLLPAMYKAGAFVTDAGGITSHAAIVAREMKKPCVTGTKIATEVFKDGDLVEVNANTGIVKLIK